MKKIMCDTCGKGNARMYRYSTGKDPDPSGCGYVTNWNYVDLCFDCLQDFVLKHQKKLSEVVSDDPPSNKGIIHG